MMELPNGWVAMRLGAIAAHTTNVDPSKSASEFFELYSVPSYSERVPEVVEGSEIKSAKQAVQPDDILLCKIVPHLNRVWVVGQKTEMRQIASGEWIVYRYHECEPKFLRYCLTETSFRDQFMQTVAGVGGSLMRARPSGVADIEIGIAPLSEQRRIVAKIDSLSAKSGRARDHLDHLPRLVEKYKQAVLAAAFRGDLTREWRTANSGSQDASQFISERLRYFEALRTAAVRGRDEKSAQIALDQDLRKEIGIMSSAEPLPLGWQWAALGLAFGVYVGATPSRKQPELWGGSLRWVSSGEVAFCRIGQTRETITDLGLKNTSTRLHPPGTLLIGMIGEGKTRGQTAILDIEAANNQNCAAIRVSEAGYCPEYVYWYFWMSYERTRTMGAGNNQPALNKDRVQRLLVPLAPPLEAFEVARRIGNAFEWMDRLASETTNALKLIGHLDQAVLAKAFRGELVPQDPSDEPASVLLERIRAERATSGRSTGARGRPMRTA
jgi:type I restriction enzyme S subunit